MARIYNLSLSDIPDARPLAVDTVWNAFYIHALLLNSVRTAQSLIVPHHGSHTSRLMAALEKRNADMANTGQPQWAHACDMCEKVYRSGDSPEDVWGRYLSCAL